MKPSFPTGEIYVIRDTKALGKLQSIIQMLGVYSSSWLLIVNLGTYEINVYVTCHLLFQILKNYQKSSIKSSMNDKMSI